MCRNTHMLETPRKTKTRMTRSGKAPVRPNRLCSSLVSLPGATKTSPRQPRRWLTRSPTRPWTSTRLRGRRTSSSLASEPAPSHPQQQRPPTLFSIIGPSSSPLTSITPTERQPSHVPHHRCHPDSAGPSSKVLLAWEIRDQAKCSSLCLKFPCFRLELLKPSLWLSIRDHCTLLQVPVVDRAKPRVR